MHYLIVTAIIVQVVWFQVVPTLNGNVGTVGVHGFTCSHRNTNRYRLTDSSTYTYAYTYTYSKTITKNLKLKFNTKNQLNDQDYDDDENSKSVDDIDIRNKNKNSLDDDVDNILKQAEESLKEADMAMAAATFQNSDNTLGKSTRPKFNALDQDNNSSTTSSAGNEEILLQQIDDALKQAELALDYVINTDDYDNDTSTTNDTGIHNTKKHKSGTKSAKPKAGTVSNKNQQDAVLSAFGGAFIGPLTGVAINLYADVTNDVSTLGLFSISNPIVPPTLLALSLGITGYELGKQENLLGSAVRATFAAPVKGITNIVKSSVNQTVDSIVNAPANIQNAIQKKVDDTIEDIQATPLKIEQAIANQVEQIERKAEQVVDNIIATPVALVNKTSNAISRKVEQVEGLLGVSTTMGIMTTPTPTLNDWSKNRDGSITGIIQGSKTIPDGQQITTSIIINDVITSSNNSIVECKSGARYYLGVPSTKTNTFPGLMKSLFPTMKQTKPVPVESKIDTTTITTTRNVIVRNARTLTLGTMRITVETPPTPPLLKTFEQKGEQDVNDERKKLLRNKTSFVDRQREIDEIQAAVKAITEEARQVVVLGEGGKAIQEEEEEKEQNIEDKMKIAAAAKKSKVETRRRKQEVREKGVAAGVTERKIRTGATNKKGKTDVFKIMDLKGASKDSSSFSSSQNDFTKRPDSRPKPTLSIGFFNFVSDASTDTTNNNTNNNNNDNDNKKMTEIDVSKKKGVPSDVIQSESIGVKSKKRKAPYGVPILSKWKLNENGTITGILSGSKVYPDGQEVTTSLVERDVEDYSIVSTVSGSRYYLDSTYGSGFMDRFRRPMTMTMTKSKSKSKNMSMNDTKKSVKKQQSLTFKSGAPIGVPMIAKWKKNRDGSVTGIISGSKSYSDGETVTTSPLSSLTEAIGGTVVVTTSGSRYFLDSSTDSLRP